MKRHDAADALHDTPDLQALFDTIVEAREKAAPDTTASASAALHLDGSCTAEKLLREVGQLTRTLHDSLRALGYDRLLEEAAASIPDTRDRLGYIAAMTERAAVRALNAVEIARPLQQRLGQESARLAEAWDRLLARELAVDEFKALVHETRAYLAEVPAHTAATEVQLTEIMMAQDFQDLTGQVIKKITDVAQEMERKLVGVLVENARPGRREEARSLLNGPVTGTEGRRDVVSGQDQVDELLESLGF